MNLVAFAVFVLSLSVGPSYSGTGKGATRVFCPRVSVANGRARYYNSRREVRFRCLPSYRPLGEKNAACVRGKWTAPPPVCVKAGCGPTADPATGSWQDSMGGAVATLVCDPGYALASATSADIFCDGANWRPRRGPPECRAIMESGESSCDFETEDICGWGQDTSLEFIWIRNNYSTPSGFMQTGPSFDHTFGEGFAGHYMYIESSSPRKEGDIARLYSPVYNKELAEDGCFMFWYHMYGINTGSLKIYIKPQSQSLKNLEAAFQKTGNQGPRWIQDMVSLSSINESFQVIIEAIRGNGFLGDSAIDDVALRKGTDCVIIPDQPITAAIRQDTETSTERTYRDLAVKTFPTFLPAPPLPELPPMPPVAEDPFTAQPRGYSSESPTRSPLTPSTGSPMSEGTFIPQNTTNRTFVPRSHTLAPQIITNHALIGVTYSTRISSAHKSEKTSNRKSWSEIKSTTVVPTKSYTVAKSSPTSSVTVGARNISTIPQVDLKTKSNAAITPRTPTLAKKTTTAYLSTVVSRPTIRTPTFPSKTPNSTIRMTQHTLTVWSRRPTVPSNSRTTKRSPTLFFTRKLTLKPTTPKAKIKIKPVMNTTTTDVATPKPTTEKTTPLTHINIFTVSTTRKTVYWPYTFRYRTVLTTTQTPSATSNTPLQASPTTTATKRSNYRDFQRVVKPVSAPANKAPSASTAKTIVIVLVVALTVLLFTVLAFFMARKRLRQRRQRNVAEDSDVRYLTSDEILDFNLAKPADDEA